MDDFIFFTNHRLRYLSTHFYYSYDDLFIKKNGGDGDGQALMVAIMESWSYEFIIAIKEGKELHKIEGVEYFDEKNFIKFCGFRKDQVQNWKSDERLDLLKAFYNTPLCFAYWKKSIRESESNMSYLFPKIKIDFKPESLEPIKEVCKTCELYKACDGTEKFRCCKD